MTELELARQEGRNEAFAAMMKHAEAVMLGAEDRPRSVYDLFIKALRAASEGVLPARPSLSFAERRFIAREFISENCAYLFKE